MDENEFYRELVRRYVENNATAKDMEAFFHFMEDGRLDSFLAEAMMRASDSSIADPVLEALGKETAEIPVPAFPRRLRFRYLISSKARVAAAAVLLLVAGAAGYWISQVRHRPAFVDLAAATREIVPGSDRAVLILSDGRQIDLDSVPDGLVVDHDGAIVIKLDRGRIAYKPARNGRGAGRSGTVLYTDRLVTPRGGQYQLILPDGTEVMLNAASSISFPAVFAKGDRTVSIKGEAFFNVHHNPRHAFRVKVNGMTITDIGTKFNVNGYSDEAFTRTTLIEGAVKVDSILLRPGQQAQVATAVPGAKIPAGGTPVIQVSDVDTGVVVSWKNGNFSFRQTPLTEVMKTISRWYDVDVVYDGDPGDRRFGGNIPRNATAAEVLRILESTNVHFIIEGKKITVKP